MQPMTPHPELALDKARFEENDVVALTSPWPEVKLDEGVWGTVLKLFGDATYEVEFTDREGEPLMMLRVPHDRLELVWSDDDE